MIVNIHHDKQLFTGSSKIVPALYERVILKTDSKINYVIVRGLLKVTVDCQK